MTIAEAGEFRVDTDDVAVAAAGARDPLTKQGAAANGLFRATLHGIAPSGAVLVRIAGSEVVECDVLETVAFAALPLSPGDVLLVSRTADCGPPVVLGRVRRRSAVGCPDGTLILGASESLTLACGDASLTLKSNGQVLLKGEDVTVRAKGTQRIRAGNVAIN